MRKITITIKTPSDAPAEWDQLSYSCMRLLHSRYELLDDECICNTTIKEYLENWSTPEKAVRHLRDLTIALVGADWKSATESVGNFLLVGDKYNSGSDDWCPNCGSQDYTYYGDGMMYCSTCEHEHFIDDDYQSDDFDLFGKLNSILKP
jgi:hypothetical protein